MQPSSARRLSVTHFKHTSWPCLNQRLRPAVREVKLKVPRCHFTAGQKEKWSPAGCLPVVGSDMMTAGGNTCSSDRKSLRPMEIIKQQGAQCCAGALRLCVCVCVSEPVQTRCERAA